MMHFWKEKIMDKSKKILVAGGSGLVGMNTIKRLVKDGWTDIVATYNTTLPKNNIEGVNWIHVDLTKRDNCEYALKNVSYLLILAASTSGAATIKNSPLVHVTPNILINSQLLEAAHFGNVEKVIWLSSTTGYPEIDGETFEDDMFKGEPYEKYFCVGWMKRYTEILMRTYAEKLPDSHMSCIVLRPTNIYGPHDKFDPQKSHVLPALIKKVVDGMDPIEVWGDGKDVRDLIYVDDMIEAIMCALKSDIKYDTFNIGCGYGKNVDEILKIIMETNETFRKIVYDSSKPTMIKSRLVNIDKAKELLGFKAKTSLEDGIKKTIEWYKENEMD